MAAKQQKTKIDISDYELTKDQRDKLGELIIERIYERTTVENKSYTGRSFPKYSESYKKSLDFKVAGKSASDINLELSGDMLAALRVLSDSKNQITVGFDADTDENARAEGNILGSYGGAPNPKKARDFLGINSTELKKLVQRVKRD